MCSRRNATERVAMLLMHLHRRIERIGMERKDVDGLGGTIDFPLNQQRIADNLGPVAGTHQQHHTQALQVGST